MLITDTRHPLYRVEEMLKYRLTYEGGVRFVENYLQKLDSREDDTDFERRKQLAYNPAFAAEALDEVKNGIGQRMSEVVRTGGTESFQTAITGKGGGVDLRGRSMGAFMSQDVLRELLVMGRVGVYIDMPQFSPEATLADNNGRPYLYFYQYEDILNWRYETVDGRIFPTVVLLRERRCEYSDIGLPLKEKDFFRLVKMVPEGGVKVYILDRVEDPKKDEPVTENVIAEYYLPKLTRLPFVPIEIFASMLKDVANYQIGLLNLASADMAYALQANFPFYIEGYDPKTENTYNRMPSFDSDGNPTALTAAINGEEMVTGTKHGRKYPLDARHAPAFIHPSSEPLKASMDKQEQMKNEIRRLLNLNLSNVAPTRASAESKKVDQTGVESGLAAIGEILEAAELHIAEIWCQYEDESDKKVIVAYPRTYSLKTDDQRMSEAKQLEELKGAAPSRTFQKAVSKQIAISLLDGKVDPDTLKKIEREIDSAKYATSNVKDITVLFEAGVCDGETAAAAVGFDPSIVEKAAKERVERMRAIAQAQTPGIGAARGAESVPGDTSADDEKEVSQSPENNPAGKAVRGEANG